MTSEQPRSPADAQPMRSGALRSWSTLSWEARLLAASLRSAPVTLLHGGTAAERSALLRLGVLPLLGRRGDDHLLTLPRAKVFDFPERRSGVARGAAAAVELVLHLGPQQRSPALLLAAAMSSLADTNTPSVRRVLLVLDGSEPLLGIDDPATRAPLAAAPGFEAEALRCEIGRWMGSVSPVLHLLMATEDVRDPALLALGSTWPSFGEHALQLDLVQRHHPPKLEAVSNRISAPTPAADSVATVASAAATSGAVDDADWTLALQGALERVAEQGRRQGAPGGSAGEERPMIGLAAALPTPDLGPEPAAAAGPTEGPAHPSSGRGFEAPGADPAERERAAPAPDGGRAPNGDRPRKAPVRRVSAMAAASVALGCAVLAATWFLPMDDGRPRASPPETSRTVAVAPSSAATATTASTAQAPATAVAVQGADPALELAQALGPLALKDRRGRVPAPADAPAEPVLQIVRYDDLQSTPAGGSPSLEVVAPLFVEPLIVYVPNQSPLQFLHELRGRKVDIGSDPASSAGRALAALFPGPATSIDRSRLSDAAAAAALEGGRIDAIARVGYGGSTDGPGTAWRRLRLDPAATSTAIAQRQYLRMPLQPQGETLGVMSFIAVAGSDAADAGRLAAEALQALCGALPALRSNGHPAWLDVRPTAELPVGRPYAAAARAGAAACTAGDVVAPARVATNAATPARAGAGFNSNETKGTLR